MEEFKQGFLKYFYEISKIPRKSGNEEKIAKYLIEFAKERNLKYYTDSKFNVIIWKDASIGYEDKEILGFQCHTDMVCEKVDGSNHDFLKDSLDLIIENGFLKAKDTTLGADNGIGVAYILEILDSNLNTPKLECIFTSTEETTMEGVRFLDGNILKSKRIISFDNFLDTEILVSSATAKRWVSKIYMKRQEKDENLIYYKLDISGFKGGHSGIDIWNKKRGNPIKIVADMLNELESISISEIKGGSSENVIPRDIKIVFAIEKSERGIIEKIESKFEKEVFELEERHKYLTALFKGKTKKWDKDFVDSIIDKIFIGKDNIVFHCIIFPAMLKAEGSYILPTNVPANEFLNLEGNKLSTSKNWAVWLHEYLQDFPNQQDVLRYALTANAPETKDNDFTWKDFQARNNNELVAIFGNFINRVAVLTQKYFFDFISEA